MSDTPRLDNINASDLFPKHLTQPMGNVCGSVSPSREGALSLPPGTFSRGCEPKHPSAAAAQTEGTAVPQGGTQ